MTNIVKIGNSRGIRIPKPLIEQAKLEGKELDLQLVDNGLLITPKKQPRDGWKDLIEQSLATTKNDTVNQDWLNFTLASDDELEW